MRRNPRALKRERRWHVENLARLPAYATPLSRQRFDRRLRCLWQPRCRPQPIAKDQPRYMPEVFVKSSFRPVDRVPAPAPRKIKLHKLTSVQDVRTEFVDRVPSSAVRPLRSKTLDELFKPFHRARNFVADPLATHWAFNGMPFALIG